VLYDFPFPLELPSVYLWFYRYVAKRKRPFSTFPLNVDPGKHPKDMTLSPSFYVFEALLGEERETVCILPGCGVFPSNV